MRFWKKQALPGAAVTDVTAMAANWAAAQGAPQPGGLNPGMIVGARITEMVANFRANLRNGHVKLALALAKKQ